MEVNEQDLKILSEMIGENMRNLVPSIKKCEFKVSQVYKGGDGNINVVFDIIDLDRNPFNPKTGLYPFKEETRKDKDDTYYIKLSVKLAVEKWLVLNQNKYSKVKETY